MTPKTASPKMPLFILLVPRTRLTKMIGAFYDFEAVFRGCEFHLYLEGIALEFYFVERQSLEDASAVADKSGGGVVDRQAGDESDVFRCVIRHQHTPHWPVDDVDAGDIPRADGDVGAFDSGGVIEFHEVGRIMREIGVHLEDKVIAVIDRPLNTGDISRAETQLALAFDDVDASGILLHLLFDDGGVPSGELSSMTSMSKSCSSEMTASMIADAFSHSLYIGMMTTLSLCFDGISSDMAIFFVKILPQS